MVVACAAVATGGIAANGGRPPSGETVTVGLAKPYMPRAWAQAKDDYRCFLLDPKLERDVLLTRARFRPGVRQHVHHIILFRVPPDEVGTAVRLDRRTRGQGWRCFGGTGLNDPLRNPDILVDAGWLAAWAPSRTSGISAPAGTGVPLAKGSRIVMQVHYSLYGRVRPDRTRVMLSVVPQAGSPLRQLRTMLVPAPVELACRPGNRGRLCDRDAALADLAKRHGAKATIVAAGLLALCGRDPRTPRPSTTTSCQTKVEHDTTVYAAAGHMHLLGKSLRLELNPGTPRARVLVSIHRWDFHDQRLYYVAPPARVAAGSTLRVTCRHEQPRSGREPPRYVVWGEGTSDEMCLGVLQVTSG